MHEVYEDKEFVHLVLDNCNGGALSEMFEGNKDEDQNDLDGSNSQNSFESYLQNNEKELFKFQSELQIKKVVRKILYTVKLLHDVGICHRDLKLNNILWDINPDDALFCANIKVIDFGLSCAFNPEDLSSSKFT